MSRGRHRWFIATILTLFVNCTRPRTQLMVVVDTDMTWGPSGLLRATQITVRSNDPEGQLRDRRTVTLGEAVPLPASFGIVPADGDTGRRVWVEVRGCGERGCEAPLVTRQAYVGFVEGQTLLLRLTLADSCQRVTCAAPTQTCLPTTGECGSALVETSSLPSWSGLAPDAGFDTTPRDARSDDDRGALSDLGSTDEARDAITPADIGCTALCQGGCVNLETDPVNCGACGRVCTTTRENSVGTCVAGACEARCATNFGDCDADAANGCEADLRADTAQCGRCGMSCPLRANARSACVDGVCGFICNAGFADCDGDGTNGCEVTLATDSRHCGQCGRSCSFTNAAAACGAGICAIGSCSTGFADCDRSAANGCERDLRGDVANCGACGAMCRPANAAGTCASGTCRVGSCASGFGDCDGSAANGCERDLRGDASNCGQCGRACALSCDSARCLVPTQVDVGPAFSCARMSDSSLRCWGSTRALPVGAGGTSLRAFIPTVLEGVAGVARVEIGSGHTCLLLQDATVRCWGGGGSSAIWTASGMTNVNQLVSGGEHSCALRSDGAVWCWGHNQQGQLGDGTNRSIGDFNNPVRVVTLDSLPRVTSIAAGYAHTCAVFAEGTVRCWGSNTAGQIGIVQPSQYFTRPELVPNFLDVAEVAAGAQHTCARTRAGLVYCWGANERGQLGVGTTTASRTPLRVTTSLVAQSLSLGPYHSCLRTSVGALHCWGDNSLGQLGYMAAPADQLRPGRAAELPGAVASHAAHETHACAVSSEGMMQCWGTNDYGQLGDGTIINRATPGPVRWSPL